MPNPGSPGDSSTLLLDAHNAAAAKIEAIHAGLGSYRSLSIRRVYGHWKKSGQPDKNDTDKKPKGRSKLTSLLRRVADVCKDENHWTPLGLVGNHTQTKTPSTAATTASVDSSPP